VLIRHGVESAQGQSMLRRYEEAVRRMRALPPRDPRSWVYQWYIHAVPNEPSLNLSKANELNRVFGAGASAGRTLADRTWSTCQAHFGSSNERFFLPWHRMFVYYFERICRSVLEDPTFTLPYWNYTSGSGVMPALFRNPASPLFSATRNAGPNQGRSIGPLSADQALAIADFTRPGDINGFSETLDEDPHGSVHVAVGNRTRGMGTVPWAAQDPIFWVHHCNIDRLWKPGTALADATRPMVPGSIPHSPLPTRTRAVSPRRRATSRVSLPSATPTIGSRRCRAQAAAKAKPILQTGANVPKGDRRWPDDATPRLPPAASRLAATRSR
jgi:tyrosinase